MNYAKHLRKGLVEILKNILKEGCESGFQDGFGLTVTFSTENKYVVVPERIKWPNEMKIFLSEGTFEDLRVYDTFFEIVLYFDDVEELLKIPYVFVKKIESLESNFELNIMQDEDADFFITDDNVINIDFEKNK